MPRSVHVFRNAQELPQTTDTTVKHRLSFVLSFVVHLLSNIKF
jgi:hypothetical protein